MVLMELLLAYKYRMGRLDLNDLGYPHWFCCPWVWVALITFAFWFYLRFKVGHTVKYPQYDCGAAKSKRA